MGHRQRLIAGLAQAMAERPYPQVRVADIVRHAHTSRRTFYEHFADKQACLVALIEQAHGRVVATIAEAVDESAPWRTQVHQAMRAWADAVASDPGSTLNWIRVVPALGADARQLLRGTLAAYAELIRRLTGSPAFAEAGVTVPSPEELTMLLGALRELIATTVEDGRDMRSIVDSATAFAVRVLAPAPGDVFQTVDLG